MPAAGAGISESSLSVEILRITSSLATGSPTFLRHLDMVASAIDSPITPFEVGLLIRKRSATYSQKDRPPLASLWITRLFECVSSF